MGIRRPRMRWACFALVAVAALSGCTGVPQGGGASTSSGATSATSPATSSGPPTTSATTSTELGARVGIPQAARAHTKAGAKAYLEYFIDQLNHAWTTPDAHALDGLCRSTSKACAAFRGTASDLVAKGQRYSKPPATIKEFGVTSESSATYRLVIMATQNRSPIVDSQGREVKVDPKQNVTFAAYLEWRTSGWYLQELKTIANG